MHHSNLNNKVIIKDTKINQHNNTFKNKIKVARLKILRRLVSQSKTAALVQIVSI